MIDGGSDPGTIRVLFDALADLDAADREGRMRALTPELRTELEALMRGHTEEGPFDALAGKIGEGERASTPTSAETLASLAAGLGDRYRLERQIGEGGMAVVYLAEDLRHRRRVALKVLKPELAALVGAERFLAEIRTTANLQHPHVLPLFDSGEVDGWLYYVMPFVPDESLRQRLERDRQLPIGDAIEIAADVAEALEHAHGAGVVHRDVKPENVLLTEGGAIVADFGIALLRTDAAGARRLTELGVRVGTPRYMSPEQATGSHQVGPAADVYALGCVLYEMLAGIPPHDGRTPEAIVSQGVAGAHEPVRRHRASVPAELDAVVMRALAPLPADRYRSASELVAALRSARPEGARGGPRARWLVPAASAAAAAAAIAGTLWITSPEEVAPGPAADPVARQVTFEGDLLNASISPDGQLVTFVAGREGGAQRIGVQSVDGAPPTVAPSTGGQLYNPQWSPDGRSVAITGLPLRTYVFARDALDRPDSVPSGHVYAAWAPGGDRLLGWSAKRADVTVLDLSTRTVVDSIGLGVPIEWVLGASWANAGDRIALSVVTGGLDGIWTLDLASDALVPVVRDTLRLRHPVWSSDDSALYYARSLDERDTEVWRVGVAPDGGASGAPRRVFGPVPMLVRHGIQPPYSISEEARRLLYVEQRGVSNLVHAELGSDGSVASFRPLTTGTAERSTPRLSPDGAAVAYVRADSRGSHIAVMDLESGESRRVTFLEGDAWSPAWSEDGSRIAFGSNHEGSRVWTVDVGAGSTRALDDAPFEPENHIAWGGLGGVLVQMPGDRTLRLLPDAEPGASPMDLTETPSLVYDPRPAPSGEWLAMAGPGAGSESRLWLVAPDGSEGRTLLPDHTPVGWTADGSGVYTMTGGRMSHLSEIFLVPLAGGPPTLHATLPFAAKPWEVSLSRDGRTIVAAVEEPRTDAWVVEGFDPGAR